MTKAQELQIRSSEIRSRLNELVHLEKLDDAQRDEADRLTSEFRDVETRLRAALTAEADAERKRAEADDGEAREARAVAGKVALGRYAAAVVEGRALDGAEAEYNAAARCDLPVEGGVRIPFGLLEKRADATTDTGSLTGGIQQQMPLPRLFGGMVADLMGVRVDTVPPGRSEWPLLTDGALARNLDENAVKDADEATFSTITLRPKRQTCAYLMSRELAAQVAGVEAFLTGDLSRAMGARVQHEILGGDSSSQTYQVRGLMGNAIAAPADPADVAVLGDYIDAGAQVVDGLHAADEMEASVLVGVATYQHMAALLAANTDRSALEILTRRVSAVRATPHIGAPASNIQDAIVHGGMDMMRGDSVLASWGGGVELIRDPYSGAAKGQVRLTVVMMWDFYGALRSAAYKRLKFKLA